MNQALYAHMNNKRKMKKKKEFALEPAGLGSNFGSAAYLSKSPGLLSFSM
jgi:hypothetical protein